MRRVAAIAGFVICRAALWSARGVLDIAGLGHDIVRVAMLPPWWLLGVTVTSCAMIGVGLARGPRDLSVAYPLGALVFAVLPFLPWLPDRLPVLRAAAGPARGVVWFVVLWLSRTTSSSRKASSRTTTSRSRTTISGETTARILAASCVPTTWRVESTATWVMVLRGVAIGALPWLSTKYAPMAAVVGLIVFVRSRRNVRAVVALSVPVVILLFGWFAFFHAYWGTFSPTAPYGTQENMALSYLARGGLGLLFDQEYGVVALAPVCVLAIAGLGMMLRAGGAARWKWRRSSARCS